MHTILDRYQTVDSNEVTNWFKAGAVEDFPIDSGACVKINNRQIAVFHFLRRDKWYATQNLCPHKLEMVLSRGLIGDADGESKLVCPLHKKAFSLETGENLNGDLPKIATYPVKTEGGFVYVGLID